MFDVKKTLLAGTVAGFLAVSPAVAQTPGAMGGMMGPGSMHGQQQMGMSGGMMMGMMAPAQPGPAMLLGASETLGLSEAQVQELRELQDRWMQEGQEHMQAAMAARMQAMDVLQGESPDLAAYGRALGEAADHMVEAHVAHARTSVEARGVLNPEQRERLADAMAMMQSMPGGMMHGMPGGMMHRMPGGGPGGR